MTSDQLRATRDAVPFKPFTIRMVDGRSFLIPHRDYVSISPNGRIVIVYQSGDAANILDALLMTELTVEGSPAPPAANGPG